MHTRSTAVSVQRSNHNAGKFRKVNFNLGIDGIISFKSVFLFICISVFLLTIISIICVQILSHCNTEIIHSPDEFEFIR